MAKVPINFEVNAKGNAPGVFARMETSIKSIAKQGETVGKAMRLGGAAMIAGHVTQFLEKIPDAYNKWMDLSKTGASEWDKLSTVMAETIPVVGDLAKAFHAIWNMDAARKLAEADANKAARAAFYDRQQQRRESGERLIGGSLAKDMSVMDRRSLGGLADEFDRRRYSAGATHRDAQAALEKERGEALAQANKVAPEVKAAMLASIQRRMEMEDQIFAKALKDIEAERKLNMKQRMGDLAQSIGGWLSDTLDKAASGGDVIDRWRGAITRFGDFSRQKQLEGMIGRNSDPLHAAFDNVRAAGGDLMQAMFNNQRSAGGLAGAYESRFGTGQSEAAHEQIAVEQQQLEVQQRLLDKANLMVTALTQLATKLIPAQVFGGFRM